MLAAHKAGISVFVTGGIGGVHRGAANSKLLPLSLYECILDHQPVCCVFFWYRNTNHQPTTQGEIKATGWNKMNGVLGYNSAL